MKEIWKKIEKFENYYVSNLGNVKSYQKLKNGTTLKAINDSGYLYVNLCNSNSRKKIAIHRLVAIYFLDNKENKKEVNHINGIKNDNRIENLEWCTVKENNIHAIKLGLSGQLPGEKHHMSKLKEKEVLEIINNKDSLYQWQLALAYNISQTQVSRIINKKRWNHV